MNRFTLVVFCFLIFSFLAGGKADDSEDKNFEAGVQSQTNNTSNEGKNDKEAEIKGKSLGFNGNTSLGNKGKGSENVEPREKETNSKESSKDGKSGEKNKNFGTQNTKGQDIGSELSGKDSKANNKGGTHNGRGSYWLFPPSQSSKENDKNSQKEIGGDKSVKNAKGLGDNDGKKGGLGENKDDFGKQNNRPGGTSYGKGGFSLFPPGESSKESDKVNNTKKLNINSTELDSKDKNFGQGSKGLGQIGNNLGGKDKEGKGNESKDPAEKNEGSKGNAGNNAKGLGGKDGKDGDDDKDKDLVGSTSKRSGGFSLFFPAQSSKENDKNGKTTGKNTNTDKNSEKQFGSESKDKKLDNNSAESKKQDKSGQSDNKDKSFGRRLEQIGNRLGGRNKEGKENESQGLGTKNDESKKNGRDEKSKDTGKEGKGHIGYGLGEKDAKDKNDDTKNKGSEKESKDSHRGFGGLGGKSRHDNSSKGDGKWGGIGGKNKDGKSREGKIDKPDDTSATSNKGEKSGIFG